MAALPRSMASGHRNGRSSNVITKIILRRNLGWRFELGRKVGEFGIKVEPVHRYLDASRLVRGSGPESAGSAGQADNENAVPSLSTFPKFDSESRQSSETESTVIAPIPITKSFDIDLVPVDIVRTVQALGSRTVCSCRYPRAMETLAKDRLRCLGTSFRLPESALSTSSAVPLVISTMSSPSPAETQTLRWTVGPTYTSSSPALASITIAK